MAGIMYLGNQMVSPVVVKGIDGYIGREVTEDGKYQVSENILFSFPPEIKDVGDYACKGLFENFSIQGIDDSSLEKVTGNFAFSQAFTNSLKNKVAHFRNIESITGDNSFAGSFIDCDGTKIYFDSLKSIKGNQVFYNFASSSSGYSGGASIEEANFDKLEEVDGDLVFYNAFNYNNSIKKLDFKKLKSVNGRWVFASCCYGASSLEEFIMDELEEIGDNTTGENPGAFYYCFNDAIKIKKISFNSLKTVGINGLSKLIYSSNKTYYDLSIFNVPMVETAKDNAFKEAFQISGTYPSIPKLNVVSFDSLANIQYPNVFKNFAPESLKILMFKSLNENSFGSYTNQFNNMLQHCTDCIVFFPSSLESIIGNWSDVLTGFGGTNTTVIFRMPMEIIVNVTPFTASVLFTGNRNENTLICLNNINYYGVFDSTNERVIFVKDDNYIEGDVRTVDIDMDSYSYNKITINTGVELYNMYLTWNGLTIPVQEEETGVYSCYMNISVGESVGIISDGSFYYAPISTSFTTTGSDVSISITPTEKETRTFERPNLTANGVLGGENFAVTASSESNAYRAVDSLTSSSWAGTVSNIGCWYTIYNPKALLINSITFTFYGFWGIVYGITDLTVCGSHDNENWDELETFSVTPSEVCNITMSNKNWYKYYRFYFTPSMADLTYVSNIAFDALEDISE